YDFCPISIEGIARRWTSLTQPPTCKNFLIWVDDNPVGINLVSLELELPSWCDVGPIARGNGFAYNVVPDYGISDLGFVEIRVDNDLEIVPVKMLMERKFGVQAEKAAGLVDQFRTNLLLTII
ncbi:Acyl-CoA N-acyltransferase, partial [Penicillium taxi]|uniref:Acyl-CoA N-acyltransferase n=1 Tax=Penicillium taxi TaxID=168475 RepID=UPI0025456369